MNLVETLPRYRWVILALALLSQVGAALSSMALAPLAPLFQEDLSLNKTEVGLFSSSVFAGSWCVLLVMGSAADRFGVRVVMSIGLLLSGALLVSVAAISSALQIALVMFVVGLGRGGIFPCSTKAIMDWFPASARGALMGLKQTGMPVGGILVAATLPIVALAVGWRGAIGLVGFAIVTIGIATAVLYRDPKGEGSASSTHLSVLSSLREVLRSGSLWIMGVVGLLFMMAQQGLLAYLALYLTEVVLVPSIPDAGARVVAAGGFLATCNLGGVFGRVFWGWVSDRWFHQQRMMAFLGIGATGVVILLVLAGLEPGASTLLLTGTVFVSGATAVGWTGFYNAVIAETAGRGRAGTGVGFCTTLVEFGAMTGAPVFGLVVDLTGSYRTGWLLICGFVACGTAIAIAEARRSHSYSRQPGLG